MSNEIDATTGAVVAQQEPDPQEPTEGKDVVVQEDESVANWLDLSTKRQIVDFANIMAKSGMVPKAYSGKPNDIIVAMVYGHHLGLPPTTSIQNIAVIGGKPALYGDGLLALIRSNSACPYVEERVEQVGDDIVATCKIGRYRRGHGGEVIDDTIRTFSRTEAVHAGLWGKEGPWRSYPKRMLQMRARAFAARDAFADFLTGVGVVEELNDIPMPTNDDGTPKMTVVPAGSDAHANPSQSALLAAELRTGKPPTEKTQKQRGRGAAQPANAQPTGQPAQGAAPATQTGQGGAWETRQQNKAAAQEKNDPPPSKRGAE